MKTKHTEGPWEVVDGGDSLAILSPSQNSDIAYLPNWGSEGEGPLKEMQANARLLAAAPQMFAALKAIVCDMEIENCPHCDGSGFQYSPRTLHATKDACHQCGGVGEIVRKNPMPDDLREAQKALRYAKEGK